MSTNYIHFISKKNRKQQVNILNTLSDELILLNGVPQGTALSLILYIIYVATLGNLNTLGKIYSYVDDILIKIHKPNCK